MALLLENENIILLQIPGTASTALENAIQAMPGGRSIGNKHDTLAELKASGALDEHSLAQAEVTSVVRNHFDMLYAEWYRCRTRWIMQIDNPRTVGSWPQRKRLAIKMSCVLNFPEYMLWHFGEKAKSKIQLNLYKHYTQDCTRVFQKEDLSALTEWLSERTGQSVAIPQVNVTNKERPYWMDYDRATRAMITELFHDELESFGYLF